jgi:quinol---cytochrome c reductase cytochrome b subunit, bacillus type
MTDVKPPVTPPDEPAGEEPATRDALEPQVAFAPGKGLPARIERSSVWRSMFRHPTIDTPRGRALQSFSNFFLHLYPVKIPARVLRIRYSFRLGFIITVLFGILVVTGIYLMFFYTPTVGTAYGNMQQLRTGVGFGQLVRNVHRWSAHLMVLAVVLHLIRTFYAGAYKRPREFNWVIGVVLLVLTLGLSFTGYLLPWDQLAYWAITVGTNIASAVPLIGDAMRFVLLGGTQIDQNTLLRFYVLHCFFLPALVLLLFSWHMWRVRKDGGLACVDHLALQQRREGKDLLAAGNHKGPNRPRRNLADGSGSTDGRFLAASDAPPVGRAGCNDGDLQRACPVRGRAAGRAR